jgi:hypothetical protein
VTPQYGFTGNVNLTASGLPSGVTASFGTNPTTGTSVLTLTASSTAANGTFSVAITGTSGTLTATTYVSLTINVNPAATFTLSATPSTLNAISGALSLSTVTVTFPSGFAGNVNLTASGLPSNVYFGFSPPTVFGTGTSVLTLHASDVITPGSYIVTVTGTCGSKVVNTTFTLTEVVPTFTISSSVFSGGMYPGSPLQSTITITQLTGFTGSVTLSASGFPSGVTASFSPNPATSTSILTLASDNSATVGFYTVIITGTDGGHTAIAEMSVYVGPPPPSFSLGASPSALTAVLGASGVSTITVNPLYGFTGNVSLAASGLPAGVTASFNPSPTTGASALTLSADNSVATGTYNVTVTGTWGSLTATTNVALTIIGPGFAPPGTSYGSVNIRTASPVQTLTYAFSSAITLGSTAVLTQGASGLDFVDSGSDTCVAGTAYSTGQSCTVNVTFTPMYTGTRYGAVVLNDNSGNVIATAYLQGTGVGPQVNFLPGTESAIASASNGISSPVGVAVDGGGNLFIADILNNRVLKETLTPSGYSQSTLSAELLSPAGVAVDGSGDVYIADNGLGRVLKETPSIGGYTESIIADSTNGQIFPGAVAVDGSGNVYFTTQLPPSLYKETLVAGSYTLSTIPTPGALNNAYGLSGVAVDGNGNVYVVDSGNNQVLKETPSAGAYVQNILPISGMVQAFGVTVDASGNVYVVDLSGTQVIKETPSGGTYIQSTISSSKLSFPHAVAVDGGGNVYIPDAANRRVLKEDLADAPSLTFASTAVGSASSDSPQTVTVENVGNAALNFTIPSTGDNPSISTNFTLNSSGSSACPLLNTDSSTVGMLTAGASCLLPISFTPTAAGALTGSLALTDNNLNAAAPGYAVQNISLSGTGTQATPTITWTTPAAITYGTQLSGVQLNAISTMDGTFTYSPAAGTVLGAGQQTLTVTFVPADTTDYTTATATVTLTVDQATPPITWAAAASITYGTPLSASQLDAGSAVSGSFSYSPAAGTVLTAGQHMLTATFTPTDTADYTAASASVTLTVNQASPTITWVTPAPITYGTPLSATQLNANSTVAGSFTYSPAAGTVLTSGQQTLTATFTPTDATDYTTTSASVTQTVNRATPTITWARPAPIFYGTPLSATQLNASPTVAGAFTYSPAAGTVLNAGTQTLTVTFAPTDSTDYTTAMASVTLTVNKAAPMFTWATPAPITYGTPLSATQLNASSPVAGTFTYSPAAGTVLNAGTQALTATFTPTDTTDYTTASASATLTVNKAALTITWATPAAISYGTVLSATQLDANSTATGTFVYSPAAGTVLGVGNHALTVTFTPTNPTDYTTTTANATVTLTVNKATPAITWAAPAAIVYGTALSATQLNASSTVAGSFTYSPLAGTVLSAGSHTLSVTFAPTNTTDYTTANATVTLTVNKATPTITWATPAAITYGTALSGTQLDAKASIPGAFVYSPATGTVLAVGTDTLTVTFTPTDATDYTTATGSVQLKVNPAPSFTLGASPASLTVAQGASGKPTITVTGQNGFAGSVTLAASGLPSGVTAAFATNPTTGISVLTLTASGTAAVGSATVTIKGTSGSLSASTTIALTISCTPTAIVPYISINGGSTWTEESAATVSSTSATVDLGPQPASGGSWSWSGPNKYTSTSRQINSIPLTVGTDSYLATYTNPSGCKSTETFTITVK